MWHANVTSTSGRFLTVGVFCPPLRIVSLIITLGFSVLFRKLLKHTVHKYCFVVNYQHVWRGDYRPHVEQNCLANKLYQWVNNNLRPCTSSWAKLSQQNSLGFWSFFLTPHFFNSFDGERRQQHFRETKRSSASASPPPCPPFPPFQASPILTLM